MTATIRRLRLRRILDSRAVPTIEADLVLADGAEGRGSSPVPIKAGRLEAWTRGVQGLGPVRAPSNAFRLARTLEGTQYESPAEFDAALVARREDRRAGANASLAISLAFARAWAQSQGKRLVQCLAEQSGLEPRIPSPLVNLFSGGIHLPDSRNPFQQIMLDARSDRLLPALEASFGVYDDLERGTRSVAGQGLSSSSGLIRAGEDWRALIRTASDAIADHDASEVELGIGIDVAAEHLKDSTGSYRLGTERVSPSRLRDLLIRLAERYPVTILEDPFDADEYALWRELTRTLEGRVCVIGDDLFATQRDRVDRRLASGILLKPSQVGTVSGALDTARRAAAEGLELFVSHRSGETEDTAMCDFAVAVGATAIKVGGPRRGDRLAKYNQLLRLQEELGSSEAPRPPASADDPAAERPLSNVAVSTSQPV